MKNFILIQVGKKSSGKTFFCKKYVKYASKKRDVMVLDTDNEYPEYKSKNIKIINDFKKNKTLYKMMKKYQKHAESFRNGTLILENVQSFMDSSLNSFSSLVTLSRSRNVDIIMNYKSLKNSLHPKLFSNARFYIIYDTMESIERHRCLLGEYYAVFYLANNIVKNTKKSVLIDLEKNQAYLITKMPKLDLY